MYKGSLPFLCILSTSKEKKERRKIMNKILTKVTAFCVGLAMVAGVGVAVGSNAVSEAKAIDDSTYTISETPLTSLSGGEIVAFGPESTLLAKNSADSNWLRCGTFAEASVYEVVKVGTEFFLKTGTSYVYSSAVKKIALDSSNKTAITLGTNGVVQCTYGVYAYNANNGNGGIRPYASVGSMSNTYLYELSEESSATLESIEVTGYMTKTAYTTAESWDPSGLVVTAHYDDSSSKTVTGSAEWTYSPASPADGVTSVVATASYGGETASSTAQTVSVTVAHAGTAADPFTVAEGIAKCVEIGNKSGGQGPWVTTGKISSIVQVLTTGYQNARFYITEDGKTTGASIYAYDCKYLGNAGFTEETAENIVVGATVTITGNLLNYNNNTPEYARGCYLLAIQAPETGDVDVTFEPASTSFEIGATGTFTASSETSDATFAWSVDDSSVLSVNPSTGAYEALDLGVARVTVTASAGGKEGYAFVDFVVNGSAGTYYTVADANTMTSGVESGKTTAYYIYVEGYVKEFATSTSGSSPRAFDIMTLDESASIMVYTNVNPYADFVDGLSLGDRIVVKGKLQNYNSKYEIVEPEKVASNASAITFAFGFISQTDDVCEGYDGVSSNKDALEAIWEGLYTSYNALYDNQKSILMGAERDEGGTHVEQAVARYDYLVGKYGLNNFITGRTPVSFPAGSYLPSYENNLSSSSSITIIVIVAVASMTLLGVTLVIRKRKMN